MAQVKLGDVAVESRETYKGDKTGMPIVGLEHITPEEVTLSNWDTDTENTFTKRFRKGDMLFGRRRAYLKKAAQAPFDGICSGDITVIRAKEDLLLPNLLPFIIQNDSLFEFAVGKSAGSLSPRVKWENLKNYTFDLPPMEEQGKLAEALWSINDTLQAYQNLLAQTDALVQAQFEEQILPLLQAKKTIPLDELVDNNRPITYGILKPGSGYPNGIPVIKVKDMRDGIIDQSDLLLTSPEIDNQYLRSKLCAGDLLISIRGSVGRMAEVPESLEDANITQDTARLAIKENYNKVYIRGVLESNPLQHDMQKNIRGVAVKGINIGYLRVLGIPMCEQSQQDILAKLYLQAKESKSTLQNTITSLQATRRSILERALGTGRKE